MKRKLTITIDAGAKTCESCGFRTTVAGRPRCDLFGLTLPSTGSTRINRLPGCLAADTTPKPKKPEPRRTMVAGKMRTAAEVRSMAETSVLSTLEPGGTCSVRFISEQQGLSLKNTKLALNRLVRRGKVEGSSGFYMLVKQ